MTILQIIKILSIPISSSIYLIGVRKIIALLVFGVLIFSSRSYSQNQISFSLIPKFDTVYRNESVEITFLKDNSQGTFNSEPTLLDTIDFENLGCITVTNPDLAPAFAKCILFPKRSGKLRIPGFIFLNKKDSLKNTFATSKEIFVLQAEADKKTLDKRWDYEAFISDSIKNSNNVLFDQKKEFWLDTVRKLKCHNSENFYLKTNQDLYIVKNKAKTFIIEFETDFCCLTTNGLDLSYQGGTWRGGFLGIREKEDIKVGRRGIPKEFILPKCINSQKIIYFSPITETREQYETNFEPSDKIEYKLLDTYSSTSKISISMTFKRKGKYLFQPAYIKYEGKMIISNSFTVIVK